MICRKSSEDHCAQKECNYLQGLAVQAEAFGGLTEELVTKRVLIQFAGK